MKRLTVVIVPLAVVVVPLGDPGGDDGGGHLFFPLGLRSGAFEGGGGFC